MRLLKILCFLYFLSFFPTSSWSSNPFQSCDQSTGKNCEYELIGRWLLLALKPQWTRESFNSNGTSILSPFLVRLFFFLCARLAVLNLKNVGVRVALNKVLFASVHNRQSLFRGLCEGAELPSWTDCIHSPERRRWGLSHAASVHTPPTNRYYGEWLNALIKGVLQRAVLVRRAYYNLNIRMMRSQEI